MLIPEIQQFSYSIHGVAVILQLLKLLAVAKDLSRSHKEQYWKLLKVRGDLVYLED